jgi:TAT (twin-arginine translocation) pathway signal sequence
MTMERMRPERIQLDRRQFLRGLGVAGLSAAIAACGSEEGGPDPAPAETSTTVNFIKEKTRKIDERIDRLERENPHVKYKYQVDQYSGQVNEQQGIISPDKIRPLSPEVKKRVANATVMILGDAKNQPGRQVKGSGVLLKNKATGKIQVISAGHLMNEMVPESMSIITNDNRQVVPKSVSYKEVDTAGKEEDLAVVTISNAGAFDSDALETRVPKKGPTDFGEPYQALNYQTFHGPGNLATYPMVLIQEMDGPFVQALAGLHPGKTEDEALYGGSGGPAVDSDGQVVGITTGSFFETPLDCDTSPIFQATGTFFDNDPADLAVFLRKPGDVCEPGEAPSLVNIRVPDNDGEFVFRYTPTVVQIT